MPSACVCGQTRATRKTPRRSLLIRAATRAAAAPRQATISRTFKKQDKTFQTAPRSTRRCVVSSPRLSPVRVAPAERSAHFGLRHALNAARRLSVRRALASRARPVAGRAIPPHTGTSWRCGSRMVRLPQSRRPSKSRRTRFLTRVPTSSRPSRINLRMRLTPPFRRLCGSATPSDYASRARPTKGSTRLSCRLLAHLRSTLWRTARSSCRRFACTIYLMKPLHRRARSKHRRRSPMPSRASTRWRTPRSLPCSVYGGRSSCERRGVGGLRAQGSAWSCFLRSE
mmetsp:Transcript_25457/g.70217  ORF Transcript_25457/g.70217 Transcript_25457/m.70217 type:complete len:284 (-) Transcript_25457:372-1223(-)